MFTPSPRFICFIEIMKPFTKRLVCSTRRPDDTRASRCSILLPICLTKTKRTRICFKHNNNNNNNNNNKSRPRKEIKKERERPGNEDILEENRKTLFPHASVADRVPLFISLRCRIHFSRRGGYTFPNEKKKEEEAFARTRRRRYITHLALLLHRTVRAVNGRARRRRKKKRKRTRFHF